MCRRIRTESGSVTIEATISLSAFMFAIVTLLTIVNICMVQARISYALNVTAKEISQYSYLYGLTGLQNSQSEIYGAGVEDTEDVGPLLSDINTVYNEIENLGKTGNQSTDNIDDILNAWDSIAESGENIADAGSSAYNTLKDIAKDPKNLLFGIAKLAANEGLDLAKSKLIAEPLTKVMIQKHLVNEEDGNVEAYLQALGVVPSATGSYMDGLDFNGSTLFPNGSNEIRLVVSYDVKVIALLPIDFSFHFRQSAVTHGWLAGEASYQTSTDYSETQSIWTEMTVEERADLIRHMGIRDLQGEGYKKVSGFDNVQMYHPEKNEFVTISSMNPLWSAEGETPLTVDSLDDAVLQESIERLCAQMEGTTSSATQVTVKTEENGETKKTEHNCSGASNKIILVIPQDAGLQEKLQSILDNANTHGVTVELNSSYGNGASAVTTSSEAGGDAP